MLTIILGRLSALILRLALVQGRRHAYAIALGIASGTFVWGAAAAVGATALLAASEFAFTILKIVGAIYLAYLGISMIVKSPRRGRQGCLGSEGVAFCSFRSWCAHQSAQPQGRVFYITLIPQFIPEGVAPVAIALLLALVHIVELLIWFTGLIIASHFAREWLSSPRVSARIDRVIGGILVAFGVVLAVESRA